MTNVELLERLATINTALSKLRWDIEDDETLKDEDLHRATHQSVDLAKNHIEEAINKIVTN